jgi:hypothetical protein
MTTEASLDWDILFSWCPPRFYGVFDGSAEDSLEKPKAALAECVHRAAAGECL